jgi:glycosyltransferase involved in cell wall biosynthesis
MKISVIITSYNQKDYLIEAIESVLAQTVPCFELIVADDCSADHSQEVIEDYARRYPDLIRPFLHPKNLGIPRNRNFALERVRGDLVSILDGDDRFASNKNEKEVEAFERHPDAAVAFSNVWYVDGRGRRVRLRDRASGPNGDVLSRVFLRGFDILRSMLVRYSALKDIGFLDERFWHYDGFDLIIRLASKYRFIYVPAVLAEHRIHAMGSSHAICNRSIALQELRGIYEKNRSFLDGLPRWESNLVRRTWRRHLSKLEGEAAWGEGRKRRAIGLWLRALWVACARFIDPSLWRMVAGSERARSIAVWSLSIARRRPPRPLVTEE